MLASVRVPYCSYWDYTIILDSEMHHCSSRSMSIASTVDYDYDYDYDILTIHTMPLSEILLDK